MKNSVKTMTIHEFMEMEREKGLDKKRKSSKELYLLIALAIVLGVTAYANMTIDNQHEITAFIWSELQC